MFKITVGIAALNEEANIKNVITNVLAQDFGENKLIEVIVVSDGSTDKTVEEVQSIKSDLIKLVVHTTRAGKITRFNEIFSLASGDIVISLDADVTPENNHTLNALVQMFKEPGVEYVSGRAVPLKPRNMLEHSINISRETWDVFRDKLKNGNSVYSCNGKFYGITSKVAKDIKLPSKGTAEQSYIYFYCLKHGYANRGCKEARVIYRSPNSIIDHVKQIERYNSSYEMEWRDEFGPIVEKEHEIPSKLMTEEKLKMLIRHPVLCLYLYGVNFYAKKIYKPSKIRDQNWDIQSSTKGKVNND